MTDPVLMKIATVAARSVPKAGAWLIRTHQDHVDFSLLLSASLARAICPDDPDAPRVKLALEALENSLNHTQPPAVGRQSRLQRLQQWTMHLGPLGWIRRPPKKLPLDGPDFFELIRRWIQKAFDNPWPREELATVNCAGNAVDASDVLSQLPSALKDVLLEDVTPFRERLLLMIDDWRERTARVERERRNRLLTKVLASATAAAGTVAVVEATWGSHPGAAALAVLAGLGVSGLHDAARKHGFRGVRYRAARLVARIDEAVRPSGDSAPKPPPSDCVPELQQLVSDAMALHDHELGEVLEDLEDALKNWVWYPADEEGRTRTGEALARVADFLVPGKRSNDA